MSRVPPDRDADGRGRGGQDVQEHHRRLIEEQAEAWLQGDPARDSSRNTRRAYRMIPIDRNGTFVEESEASGIMVVLQETSWDALNHTRFEITFLADVMPLTADMIRRRFADPFEEGRA